MTAAPERFCPRCHVELGNVEGLELCSQCRGIFCDAGELSRVVGWTVQSRPDPAAVEGDALLCPACGTGLAPREAVGASFLACPGCRGSWLEPGAIARLRAERPPPSRPPPRPAEPTAPDAPPADSTSPGGLAADRLSFDQPLVDLLAYPITAVVAVVVGVLGVARPVAFFVQLWFHEIGHAVPAWLSGRAALPLPIGFTFWREDRSTFTALCVAFLIVVLGAASIREKRPFGIAVAVALLTVQLLCTVILPAEATVEWIVFGGLAGELVVSTLAIVAFNYRVPDRFRWDFFRFLVLVPAACTFASALAMWIRIDAGQEALPLGSILGAPGDGTGDIERLMNDHGWTAPGLTYAYRTIGLICLGIIAAHYAAFGARAWRRRTAVHAG